MYIERCLAPVIKRASAQFSVVMLTGARQAGKTTLLRALEPKRRFVSLDDLDLRRLAQEDPKLFLERFPPPVFIDEFQYAPEILPYIKIAVDEKRTRLKPCRGEFWLSGSQNFSMMTNVQESLAGRVALLKLYGLSLAEINKEKGSLPQLGFFDQKLAPYQTKKTVRELFKHILRGDRPPLWSNPKSERDLYYSSYVQTYIERDVGQILDIKDPSLFEKFLRLLAGHVGQILNMANLSRDLELTIPTIKSWLHILERSFQITLLEPYYRNFKKRLIKAPKLYFMDMGLAAYLLKWSDPETALAGPMAGALFENWVVSEIMKSYWHRGEDPRLYFWRTREGLELDLIHDSGGVIYPAEIKLGASPKIDNVVAFLSSLKTKANLAPARIICARQDSIPVRQDIHLVSAWALR